MSQSLLDQLIDSLKNDQTLDDRVEELLLKGMNLEGMEEVTSQRPK